MNFFLVLNTKEDGGQRGPSTVWFPILYKNIFFCVQQKKEIHTVSDRIILAEIFFILDGLSL